MDESVRSGHLQELRRGTVVVACLAALRRPLYGYRLVEDLVAAGFEVEGNTLYPLLRRLESQGLLSSDWNTEEARPRKYYETTADGRDLLAVLLAESSALHEAIERIGRTRPEEAG